MNDYLQPHQQRVVSEKTQLDERLGNLYAFFQHPAYAALPEYEKSLLRNQARFMDGYSAVLGERINAEVPRHRPRRTWRTLLSSPAGEEREIWWREGDDLCDADDIRRAVAEEYPGYALLKLEGPMQ